MNHTQWLETAEIYALGALDGDELRAFENHRAGCRECEVRISETRALLAELPSSLKIIEPPAAVKAALMKKIGASSAPRIAKPVAALVAGGIGLVLVLAVAMPAWLHFQTPVASPAAPVHDAFMTKLLQSPETGLVEFKNLVTGQKASAQLYWNPKDCGGCLMMKGLTPTEAGKVYELWAIARNTPVPAGTFTVDKNGNAHMDILLKDKKFFEKFAVTVEPKGGTASPTGPMKFLSL